jgi:hypothetical protein
MLQPSLPTALCLVPARARQDWKTWLPSSPQHKCGSLPLLALLRMDSLVMLVVQLMQSTLDSSYGLHSEEVRLKRVTQHVSRADAEHWQVAD